MKGIANFLGSANKGMNVPPVVALTQQLVAPALPDCLKHLAGPKGRTPVNIRKMLPWLNMYPDREAAELLSSGFTDGLFIPYILSREPVFSINLKSASELPQVLRDKVQKEVALGRMFGPFLYPPFQNFRVSPLGIVPKKETGKFRLIHHLSHPKGASVNDGISKEDASVSYVSFDRAVMLVRQAGAGALMAKSESAFRLLPVHPECYHLLGCQVDGEYFFDACLPMGCSISINFLEWVIHYETSSRCVIHYLDDFLFASPGGSTQCSFLLDTFKFFMSKFGVPLSLEKTEGPTTVLSFLSIEIVWCSTSRRTGYKTF